MIACLAAQISNGSEAIALRRIDDKGKEHEPSARRFAEFLPTPRVLAQ
jgi:hypothetical protein